MAARSRSSLMCMQSDFEKSPSAACPEQDEWYRELERHRTCLKRRCKELKTAFRSREHPQHTNGNCAEHSPVHRKARSPVSTPVSAVHGDKALHGTLSDVGSGICEHLPSPRALLVTPSRNRGDPSNATPAPKHSGRRFDPRKDRGAVLNSSCNGTAHRHLRLQRSSSVGSARSFEGGLTSCPSYADSLSERIPINFLLACKKGIGAVTPSRNRSFTLVDCLDRAPRLGTDSRHAHCLHRRGGISKPYERSCVGDRYCVTNFDRQPESRRQKAQQFCGGIKGTDKGHEQRPHPFAHPDQPRKSGVASTRPTCCADRKAHGGHTNYPYRADRCNHQGKDCRHCHRCHHCYGDNFRMSRVSCTSPANNEVGASLEATEGFSSSAREASPARRSEPGSPSRAPRQVDLQFIGNLLTGYHVNVDLLKAPELGSAESTRYVLSICREVFMGAIGAQVVYVVTSMLFGNIAAAIIVSLLCVQSAFCHCDGRPAAYVINGVLSLVVASTVTVALCTEVSGLEPYRVDPVLNTISYVYVPLCFAFGVFSFYLAHSNYDLHKRERQAIVYAVNRLLGDRFRVNQRDLTIERCL
ncbi:hypothetical protein, conserved [Babesia bigemina]|uniref:Uncharacterized protein n=1 Tax=Babesia bigemina TaxID=5866 RepID=A0A061DET7_BABBI|nr:hypothetical protein, conserved [Babesia bigemina]CDR97850.1 hypothetical protein, conserved [Babesia bigemina]|eukprot:XP_012770036.1 hypothetical protein, conserved [Babesia bigemina]